MPGRLHDLVEDVFELLERQHAVAIGVTVSVHALQPRLLRHDAHQQPFHQDAQRGVQP